MPLATIEAAIDDFREGRFVIIVDDEHRENEGDLVIAAEKVTPEAVNFMARYGRGLICLPLTGQRLDELRIPMMVQENTSSLGTAFTVSVEARAGITTGISAADRATTVKTALDPNARPDDLARPGHVFPLRAREGGVLMRAGQTEASVDLAKLAGLYPAAVICEIMDDDGTMARMPQLERLGGGARHQDDQRRRSDRLPPAPRADHQEDRRRAHADRVRGLRRPRLRGHHHGRRARRAGQGRPQRHGRAGAGADALASASPGTPSAPCAATAASSCTGRWPASRRPGSGSSSTCTRKAGGSACTTSCGPTSCRTRARTRSTPTCAWASPEDRRDYGIGAQILVDLGVRKMKIMTNNPKKLIALKGFGLELVDQIPIPVRANPHNLRYLETKRDRMGHSLTMVHE